jgi:hypothetical protein
MFLFPVVTDSDLETADVSAWTPLVKDGLLFWSNLNGGLVDVSGCHY